MIDWSFISAQEGHQQTKAYIPMSKKTHSPIMQSGVTVATGFDIGQWNTADLSHLGLAADLVQRLTPYAHPLKGAAAATKLAADEKAGNGLTLTKPEADAIDSSVRQHFERLIQKSYDRGARAKGKTMLFSSLPGQIQTAIASFMFQFGAGIYAHRFASTPQYAFYQKVTDQDWAGAIQASKSCAVPVARRNAEQRLIAQGAATLPGGFKLTLPLPSSRTMIA